MKMKIRNEKWKRKKKYLKLNLPINIWIQNVFIMIENQSFNQESCFKLLCVFLFRLGFVKCCWIIFKTKKHKSVLITGHVNRCSRTCIYTYTHTTRFFELKIFFLHFRCSWKIRYFVHACKFLLNKKKKNK